MQNRVGKGLIVAFTPWVGVTGTFLWLYAQRTNAPLGALAQHISIVVFFPIFFSALRWHALAASVEKRNITWMASFSEAAMLALLIIYYGIVVIGLDHWGKVVTFQIIGVYAKQVALFFAALGVNVLWFWFGIALLFSFVYAIILVIHRLYPVSSSENSKSSSFIVGVTTFVSAFAIVVSFFRMAAFPEVIRHEPFALSIHPMTKRFQSHSSATNLRLAQVEESARKAYQPISPQPKNLPNIIFIVVDALRADRMPDSEYQRQLLPKLREWEASSSTATHSGMHGACAESSCGLKALFSSRNLDEFVDEPITLQEVLKWNGYQIVMRLSGDHTNFYGLKEIYKSADSYADGTDRENKWYVNSDQFVIDAIHSLDLKSKKPLFLQLHLMSCHGLSEKHSIPSFVPAINHYRLSQEQKNKIKTEDQRQPYLNAYDNGVANVNSVIDQVLRGLKDRRLLENAIVVVTADHGEMLGERGEWGHSRSVWQPVLRVPFVLMRFGGSLRTNFTDYPVVSQIDIAPTVLEEIGVPVPPVWTGIGLDFGHEASRQQREVRFQQHKHIGLIKSQSGGALYKYLNDVEAGQEYVFDLVEDPYEKNNKINSINKELISNWRYKLISSEALAKESLGASPI